MGLPEAVIFDMDGVIVDTVPYHYLAWRTAFEKVGIKLSVEDYRKLVDGIPRIDGARNVLRHYGKDEKLAMQVAEEKQKKFLEVIEKEPVRLFEGVEDLITALRKNNIKVAIISSSKNMRRILSPTGILEKVDAVVDGWEVKRGKPSPDVFLIAAGKLKANPQRCVVVEDAELGVEAAKRAGMKCIGISREEDGETRLKKADKVIKSVADLNLHILDEIF